MIPIELAELCELTGGRLTGGVDPHAVLTGPVVVDSRRVTAGSLFVCLRGERVDGHEFAAAAAAAGAVAALAARPVSAPAVVVDDPLAALGQLARNVLERAADCSVVGVTGSSGKTTTKDLLAQVLASAGETVAAEETFNNEIGLPLTVARVTASTRFLVAEYAARGVGHIRDLCSIAPPQVSVVLNVGAAHLGEFGSREAIAQAKGELVEALPADGVAVLNGDDPLVAAMRRRTGATVLTFGTDKSADVRFESLELDEAARPSFVLVTADGAVPVRLRLHGAHHAGNAAATAAAAIACGLSLTKVAEALQAATALTPHRMDVRHRADGVVVVDDAYNANPESMVAGLRALARLGSGGRSWAVLGEMLELGDDSPGMHAEVGAEAAAMGVDELVTIGSAATAIAEGASAAAGWAGRARSVRDADEAVALLRGELLPGDVVLVKASNGVRLWELADRLLADVPAGVAKQ